MTILINNTYISGFIIFTQYLTSNSSKLMKCNEVLLLSVTAPEPNKISSICTIFYSLDKILITVDGVHIFDQQWIPLQGLQCENKHLQAHKSGKRKNVNVPKKM